MDVFWRHGYSGASIQKLVEGTGVSRASLYHEFGDKQSLFEAALERYVEMLDDVVVRPLFAPGDPRKVVTGVMLRAVEDRSSTAAPPCLLVQMVLAPSRDEPLVRSRVTAFLTRLDDAFERRFAEAGGRGQLPPGVEPRVLARLFGHTLFNLAVAQGANRSRGEMLDIVRGALAAAGWDVEQSVLGSGG